MNEPFSRALTLIEVLIVIAVMGIILLITFGGFASFNKTAALNAAVQITLSAFEEARSKTLASQNQSVYGVHVDTQEVVVFAGSSYNALDPDNRVKELPASVTVTNISLAGGGSDVVFNRLTGTTNQFGSVTLSSASGAAKVATIEKTGLVRE